MRVGMGYDIHRLVVDRPLLLGGVTVPFEKGLAGHSDADVLSHAICDALLGAAGLGDMGQHFPDDDPQYKGMSSLKFLAVVRDHLQAAGHTIGNVDATILCEQPKLAPYLKEMSEKISDTLMISAQQINVKATTNEGIGSIGNGEAIAAYAVVLIE